MYKYGIVWTMKEKKVSKRQKKKRGKARERSTLTVGREVGFEKGKWVQVYVQKAGVTYWIKVAEIERVRDEDSKFF